MSDEKNSWGDEDEEEFDPKVTAALQRRRDAEAARVDSIQVRNGLDQRRAKRIINSSPANDDRGLSGFDQNLLELSAQGMSLQEMSDEIGGIMRPAEVAIRVRQILGSRSWLGYMDRQNLILLEMSRLAEHVKAIVFGRETDEDNNPVYGSAQWADLLRKLFNDLARMVREHQVDSEKIRNEITQAQGKMMIAALEKAFVVFARDFTAAHPDISEEELRDTMTLALSEAIREVDKNTGDH